jgi:uncharacterized protein
MEETFSESEWPEEGQSAGARPKSRRAINSSRVRVVGILTIVGALAMGAVCWSASTRAIHPAEHGYKWSLATYPDLQGRDVRFPSRTGIQIQGRLFPGSKPAVIVLSHGYGDTQDQLLPFAHFLHQAGFSVLTYNMRSRGGSGGTAVSLGALEQTDLVSAVDFLAAQPETQGKPVGAWGISLGGATSILAAAQDSRIKALVDDSGFSDAPNVIQTAFSHFIHLPAFPFAPLTVGLSEERLGVSITDVRPMDVIGKISPRPILMIHCLGDELVPPDNTERNLSRAGEPKEVWWVPGGYHANGHSIAKAEYEARVNAFFEKSLLAPTQGLR